LIYGNAINIVRHYSSGLAVASSASPKKTSVQLANLNGRLFGFMRRKPREDRLKAADKQRLFFN
jgi:transposase